MGLKLDGDNDTQLEITEVANGWIVAHSHKIMASREHMFGDQSTRTNTYVAETPERLCDLIREWSNRNLKDWNKIGEPTSS